MSFINLLANDIWTEADMVRRTESMIRSEFSVEDEAILNRKAIGLALNTYQASEEELYQMQRYTAVAENARVELAAAMADMALLKKVFRLEDAKKTQALMPLDEAITFLQTERPEEILDEEGNVTNQAEIDSYNETYNKAQQTVSLYGSDVEAYEVAVNEANTIVDNATEEETNLYNLRNKVEV
jgi:hypothetical protein